MTLEEAVLEKIAKLMADQVDDDVMNFDVRCPSTSTEATTSPLTWDTMYKFLDEIPTLQMLMAHDVWDRMRVDAIASGKEFDEAVCKLDMSLPRGIVVIFEGTVRNPRKKVEVVRLKL